MNDDQDNFCKKYFFGTFVGTIEGGDGTPVQLTMVCASWNCVAESAAEYGCKRGERAILVSWIPAAMQYTKPTGRGFPKEAGVDKSKLPPREQWVVFPLKFDGLTVYYKRGSQAWAL